MRIGIGIDTGGTYTDAVAFDFEERKVLAKGKSRTTKEDLSVGITGALDFISADLRQSAEFIALSTTLATNACVENKGCRARLVLMGTTEKVLRRIDAQKNYGLSYEDVLCLNTKCSFDGSVVDEPDWETLVAQHDEWFEQAQAISLCEANAARNGAVCERAGKAYLSKRYQVPFVMGCELSHDVNMMSRGATALLNARLLPVIDEFLSATKRALARQGVACPVMIVRSDGSLMGEDLAFERPVETILSGPASSVHGSRELASLENCLIVDIGGTTTDISLVKGGEPVMTDGIRIGNWKTQAKGVFIETFGLGGDTAVQVRNGVLSLASRRVEPISAAAERWPELVDQLEALLASPVRSVKPAFEVLYLVREPKDLSAYSDGERELVEELRHGPCMVGDRSRIDAYTLDSERLESEGIVMRAGLTPTDAMQIKGDFERYDTRAARLAMRYVAEMLDGIDGRARSVEQLADDIYDLVEYRLYASVVKILMRDRYPRAYRDGVPEHVDEVLAQEWERVKSGQEAPLFDMGFSCRGTLVGLGAPTHIFLPRVASALGARCVIPEHAEVANAVGAVVANINARASVEISVIDSAAGPAGYAVHTAAGNAAFEGEDLDEVYEQALECARAEATRLAEAEARRRGAIGELSFRESTKRKRGAIADGQQLDLGTTVTVLASQAR